MELKTLPRRAAGLATAASLGALATLPAQAAVIDVSDVVTEIQGYTGATSPIVLIGGAILLVWVAVKAFKWVRAALS